MVAVDAEGINMVDLGTKEEWKEGKESMKAEAATHQSRRLRV